MVKETIWREAKQIQKLNKNFNENVKFIKRYKKNRLAMFCSPKDHFQFNRKLKLFTITRNDYEKWKYGQEGVKSGVFCKC